ncbi:hypothetical protein ACOMHN_038760 [Nucella lapillus]
MFGRSLELHNSRYIHLLGDGDAKAHAAVNEDAPYGVCSIEKIEAEANNQPPRPHTKPLSRQITSALAPVYKRLGDPQLLQRCLAGKTQNSNESFHSMVWRTCPKERWAGRRTVHSAVAVCVQRYNKGSLALLDVLAELDLVAGSHAELFAEKSDILMVNTATRKSSERAKQKRKKLETVRRQEREQRRAGEGETMVLELFKIIISRNLLTRLSKHYQTEGLAQPSKKSGGRRSNTRSLKYQDTEAVKKFICHYAEDHAVSLPGRVPGFKREDIRLLPSAIPRAASTGSMLTMPIKLGYELSVPPPSVSCGLSCVHTLSWQNP